MTERRYEFPDGSLYEVTVAARDSQGSRSEIVITLPPNAVTPPAHVHPAQEERWTVVDGTLDVLVGREWQRLPAGSPAKVPPGVVHTFRNRSGHNVTFRAVHAPALDFERYLDRLYWLSAMNRIRGRRDLTSLLYTSLLLDIHRRDQRPAGLGARATVRAMAQVARALRLRVDR